MTRATALKEELLETDEKFRRLFQEHSDLKKQLSTIRRQSLLSMEDEIEIKRLKISKLHLKDQMESMLREHRQEAAV